MDFFSTLFSVVVEIVGGILDNAKNKAIFQKQGEIQTAVINNVQERYSNLENKISDAAVMQYQTQLEDETKKKVAAGNITSVIVVVLIIVIAIAIIYLMNSKQQK